YADAETGEAKDSLSNPGAHGFSEVLYGFSSAGNNNGSAFAGLNANAPFYNTALGIAMLIARYWLMIPTLAVAGSLARKKYTPPGAGTLPTHTPLFITWVVATVLLVGALNFVPALGLGPIVEHLQMMARGQSAFFGSRLNRRCSMAATMKARPLFEPSIVRRAVVDSFRKLDPRRQLRNPVMFTVFIGSILTTGLGINALIAGGQESPAFIFAVS